jgi:pimeloyl-ACP methyl ester carboxylesterase
MKKSAFILVHGAFHGGWCYQKVAARLTVPGWQVHTPSLTGLADKSHLLSPDINLQTHINDVVNLVKWEGLERVVLCGHSYGGMVITGAAEVLGDRVWGLVYLDALVPTAGRSMFDYTGPELRALFDQLAEKSNRLYVTPISVERFKVNVDDRAWVDAQCTDHPYRTFEYPVGKTSVRDGLKNKYYVRATGYTSVMLDEFVAQCHAEPNWRVVNIENGHDLMLDAPEEVAAVLLEAAECSQHDGPY